MTNRITPIPAGEPGTPPGDTGDGETDVPVDEQGISTRPGDTVPRSDSQGENDPDLDDEDADEGDVDEDDLEDDDPEDDKDDEVTDPGAEPGKPI